MRSRPSSTEQSRPAEHKPGLSLTSEAARTQDQSSRYNPALSFFYGEKPQRSLQLLPVSRPLVMHLLSTAPLSD